MPPDDGVVEIPVPVPNEEEKMAQIDLPENVASMMLSESVGNLSANNRDGRSIGTLAAGVLQGAMARNFDELGTIESRANSGIIATPVASPAVQSGTTP